MPPSTAHYPWIDDPDDDNMMSDAEMDAFVKAVKRMQQARRQIMPESKLKGGKDNG